MKRETQRILIRESIRELDLIEFAAYLLKRMKWLVAAAFLGMLAATFCALVLFDPVYEATAQLYISNTANTIPSLSELQSASYLAENCRSILQTWEVSQRVIDNLQVSYDASELKNMLSITNPEKTGVIRITISSKDPKLAARFANEFAEVGRNSIAEQMQIPAPSILSEAVEPTSPTGPRRILILLAGMAVGVVLAVWGLFVVYSRDDRLRSEEDVFDCIGEYPLATVAVPREFGKNNRKGG